MRKALLTTVTPEFEDLFALSGPPLREFADRHGWSLIVNRADRSCGRPTSWGRVPLLLEVMRSYDVVGWIDADALIVDGSRDLAAELRRGKHLYWVEHAHPSGETTSNAGVMMLRSSRWSRRLLERAWASEDLIDHVWWENAALMRLLGYRIDAQPVGRGPDRRALARVRFLDLAWNSIPALGREPCTANHPLRRAPTRRPSRAHADRRPHSAGAGPVVLVQDQQPRPTLAPVGSATVESLCVCRARGRRSLPRGCSSPASGRS